MEESKALSKLGEATDLLMLLEDIFNPASIERLSQASWSGIRLTLKNARATLQESQGTLSKEFVARARQGNGVSPEVVPYAVASRPHVAPSHPAVGLPAVQGNVIKQSVSSDDHTINNHNSHDIQAVPLNVFDKNLSDQAKAQITRRDLKATLEKFIETR